MGRAPCCDKANVKKGPWSPEEDAKLKAYIDQHGTGGNWIALPQKIGLKRCGKSCRLRWLNYLRPNLRHGGFSEEEDNIICSLYINIGSRWSIIAAQLPGRTDNDIKNYWNTRLKKKLLGKQRKEARRSKHHQDQAVLTVDHHQESFMHMMMNPSHLATWPPPLLTVDQDQEIPQDLIKNLLSKLGGRFCEEPNTTNLDHLQYHTIIDNNLISSEDQFPINDHASEYMLQQLGNYPVELSDLVYGDEQRFYDINHMINVSTSSSTESSSTNNLGAHDHINYEPNFQQQENAIFQDSSYFGLQ